MCHHSMLVKAIVTGVYNTVCDTSRGQATSPCLSLLVWHTDMLHISNRIAERRVQLAVVAVPSKALLAIEALPPTKQRLLCS